MAGKKAGQRINWLGVLGTGGSRKLYAPVCPLMSRRPGLTRRITITLAHRVKRDAFMWAELLVEKFKKQEREIGRKEGRAEGREEGREIGREEGRSEVQLARRDWYRRQQEALRSGLSFDEPPPFLYSENSDHPGEST